MCTVCGCGEGQVRIDGKAHAHPAEAAHAHAHVHDHPHRHGDLEHSHPHSHVHSHGHDHAAGAGHVHGDHDHPHAHGAEGHDHDHTHRHDHHHHGTGPAGTSVPGMSQARLVRIETDILSRNNGYAASNRRVLGALEVFAVNLVSSPGSGKTTLLCRTIEALAGTPLAVIEGDQQTSNDAERIRAAGARAVQINTGKGCHLDAHMVGHAIDELRLRQGALLMIENVGNLVCPAAFDLGEDARVVILSVTEGEDKPLKYPDIFASARLAVINKTDLAPHCDADLGAYEANLRRINPAIEVIRLSARTGEGMAAWLDWLRAGLAAKAPA